MEKQKMRRVLLSVLATGIMIFCGMIIETAMNIVFPTLMREFNISTSTVQWMTTSYLLVVSVIVPLSAYLKQQYTVKALFLFAITMFLIGVLLDAFAGSFAILLIGRVVQGIGTGVALPLMFNIIIDEVPAQKMGLMMAIGTLVTAIGPAIGPTMGGLISYYLNWHYIFIFLLPLLVIAFIVGTVNIKQSQTLHKRAFNFKTYVFLPVMFVGLIICLSSVATKGVLSVQFILLLGIALVAMVIFVHRSLNEKRPLINLRIFADRAFSRHVLSFMLIQITLLGLGFLLPNFTQIVLGKSTLVAALQLLPGAIIGAICTIFSGQILDVLGARLPITSGVIVIAVMLILFSITAAFLSVPLIVAIYALFMLGLGLALGNIITNGIQLLKVKNQADGNAVFNVVQQFSGAVGTTITSTTVAMIQTGKIGTTIYRSSTSTGTFAGFVGLSVLVLLSCLLMVITLNTQKRQTL